ncbi:LysR family transcriptional regulator [Luteibacter aegosomatissinici]|uniref:LysR family transcriptional regulator n=1 Tax=Luteibacter aegosomatissinici TaxID=2911539 RepID=UPI0024B58AAD|nr:LysR family transcriptional regulator [Luteibacter aegosomatissinici]
MMNPAWLRSFTTLAAEGTFTRAAETLELTQAAVSQHIRQLEAQLGPLLIRRPRGVELTPAGHALLAYGEEVARAERCLASRLSNADALDGVVSIITPGSVGLSTYPKLLDIQRETPGLVVRHRFAPEEDVLQAVLDNRFDIGIVSRRPDDERLAIERFCEEALELVIPADAEVSDWEDLLRLGFIDHPDGQSMATRLLARRFPGKRLGEVPVTGFTNQIALILEPVARGLGFSVLPRHARRAFARQEAIRVLDADRAIVETLWLIHRAEWELPRRARHVVDELHVRLAKD